MCSSLTAVVMDSIYTTTTAAPATTTSPHAATPTTTTQDFFLLMNKLSNPPPIRRRVHFAPVVSFVQSTLQYEELKDLWYEQKDLAIFKSKARELALYGKQQQQQNQNQQQQDDEDFMRGLEHCSLERQKHKLLSIRCTLSSYRRGNSPDQTAMVARKCGAWNEEVAFVQACHDYCNVYQPAMAKLIPTVATIPPAFPFSMKKRMAPSTTNTTTSSSSQQQQQQVVVQQHQHQHSHHHHHQRNVRSRLS